jgi:Tfp pilus assembly protein PilO
MKSIDRKYFKVAGVIWVSCFAVLLLAYILVLRPQSKRLSWIENQVIEKKNEENTAREVANEKTREKLNEQIKNIKEQLNNFLIKPGDIQNVASEIQKIAEDTKLTSIKINPSSGKPIGVFDDCKYVSGHPITVNFTASFNKFATFLNELERHKSVIFIDTFSIDKSDEDSNHKVEMQLSILVEKPEQARNNKS